MSKKINHIKTTLHFCILGLFIPGFTAIAIIEIRLGLEFIFDNCELIWKIVVFGTGLFAIITPIIYLTLLNKTKKLTKIRIWIFNLLEYTFIQATLVFTWTNSNLSCNGHPAQNGLEYMFTAWTSLPILIGLSLIFDRLKIKSQYEDN